MRTSLPLLLLLAAACSSPTKSDAPAATSASAVAPAGDLALLPLRVEGVDIFVGSERVVTLQAGWYRSGDAMKPVVDKVTARRDAWSATHPGQQFNGRAEIEAAPGTPARVPLRLASLVSGYGFAALTLRSGAVTLEVPGAQWVLPLLDAPPIDGPRKTFLVFHADGTVDVKPTACLAPFDTVPNASLVEAVKEWCGGGKDCVGETAAAGDETVPFEKVLPALVELHKVSQHMTLSGGVTCGKDRLVGQEDKMPDVREDSSPGWPPPAPAPPRTDAKKRSHLVKEEKITIGNEPAPAEVIAALHARLDDYTLCYEKALETNSTLAGQLTAVLVIGQKGGVSKVLHKGDLSDESMIKCVLGAMSLAAIPPLKSKLGVVTRLAFTPGK